MYGCDGLPFGLSHSLAQETAPAGVEKSTRERDLRDQLQKILHELEELQQQPAADATAVPAQPAVVQEPSESTLAEPVPHYELSDVSIVSDRVQRRPEGVSLSSTEQSETESQPTRTLRESMESLRGVVLRQANGPRDFSISIRGSGVKTSFAVREIKMYEDGFIQTQSDGLSRLDVHDPWFMRSVEVTRGASSSLYDNYALGGMVHFRTRRGSDINGFESFLSGGSYGYQKYGFAVGKQYTNVDVSLFGSNVIEDGFIRHSDYSTQTMNFNFRVKVDDRQNLYFKAITNWLDSRVPTRLTIDQFNADHRQAGGINNATNAVLLGQRRLDRRNIIGGMYERQIDANTVLTMEADYDVKDINQTFTQISDNVNPNYKHYTDLRHDGRLFDMPLRSYVGFFVNQMEQEGQTFNNLQDFFGTRGIPEQQVDPVRQVLRGIGQHRRQEIRRVRQRGGGQHGGCQQDVVFCRLRSRLLRRRDIGTVLGVCPSHAILLRRLICRHLRRSRPVKILNVFSEYASGFYSSCHFSRSKIGRFEEGYEASFLALGGNPIDDFTQVQAITHRFGQGVLLDDRVGRGAGGSDRGRGPQ
jgi:iron complex outermembrane receptor protein